MEKIDVASRYKLPSEVKYCARCVVSNQRPRIHLDEEGVCNACRYAERKYNTIDWEAREKELWALCDRYRRDDGRHDVLVPSSGGKDSDVVAHMLKYEYGMNPLTVTWAPHIYTDIGWQNFQALIHSGLDNILGTPNGIVHRKLTRHAFEEIGEPFQPFIYGQVWFPVQVAAGFDIPLIMDGENGEVEYGGNPDLENLPGFSSDDILAFWLSDRPVEHWFDYGFTKQDLHYYLPPPQEKIEKAKIERHFFSYYRKWTPQEHFYYASENCGFKVNPDGRSEGTYSKYASLDDKIDAYHYYLMLMKFGIGRATADAAQEIRNGQIDRKEGVALVRRFDTEFPKKYLEDFLSYCDITEDYFWEVCEKWRNEDLWTKSGNEWKLRQQVS